MSSLFILFKTYWSGSNCFFGDKFDNMFLHDEICNDCSFLSADTIIPNDLFVIANDPLKHKHTKLGKEQHMLWTPKSLICKESSIEKYSTVAEWCDRSNLTNLVLSAIIDLACLNAAGLNAESNWSSQTGDRVIACPSSCAALLLISRSHFHIVAGASCQLSLCHRDNGRMKKQKTFSPRHYHHHHHHKKKI